MTILDLLNTPFKKVSAAKGGEYHGPCPACGGTDRFHVWPEQGERCGTFWCRGCGKGGDAVVYLKTFDGLTCPDAFSRIGLECESDTCPVSDKCRKGKTLAARPSLGGAIPERCGTKNGFTAPNRQTPADLWKEKATVFTDQCHQALLNSPAGLDWLLKKRGITRNTVENLRLGLNDSADGRDYYRPRPSWGLDDTGKKLWIPRGLVIPRITDGLVDRIRIRRPDSAIKKNQSEKPKRYIVVPGSCSSPLTLPCITGTSSAWVIVESELDAILLWQLCGDLVGVMAMGNSSARPDTTAHALLCNCRHISVALDYDARNNRETGKYENPGGKEALSFWLKTYSHAERTPLVGGKDPCDAMLAGIDLRLWILAGLPPAYRVCELPTQAMTTSLEKAEASTAGERAHNPMCTQIIAATGDKIWITDDRDEWKRLSDAKETVFSVGEMKRVSIALEALDEAAALHAMKVFIEAKRVFPGSYLQESRR